MANWNGHIDRWNKYGIFLDMKMASELRICSRTVPKRSYQIKIFKGRDFSIYFGKMILFYLILLKSVNADLLWWNRNRNNDLFPGVTVGERFHPKISFWLVRIFTLMLPTQAGIGWLSSWGGSPIGRERHWPGIY